MSNDPKVSDEYFFRLAKKNLCEGVHYEPRIYWDEITFPGLASVDMLQGNPDIFRNGERFPVRITHIVAAMLTTDDDQSTPVLGDERMIQRYGLRVRAHDTYYQNFRFTPFPLLANRPVAAADPITQAQSTWVFERPFLIGNRDSFQVEVQAIVAPTAQAPNRVAVVFEGVGSRTRQPKKLTATVSLEDGIATTLSTDDFRNDGVEPLEVRSMTLFEEAPASANPVGNIRNIRVRVRTVGYGTNQWWTTGPIGSSTSRCPAALFGLTTGRAVVHRLPDGIEAQDEGGRGGGWLWYPGEGVDIQVYSWAPTRAETVLVGLAGYLMVQ